MKTGHNSISLKTVIAKFRKVTSERIRNFRFEVFAKHAKH